MFKPLEEIPVAELQRRWNRCRKLLQELVPQAGGLLVLTRPSIYWLSGHLGNGALWLPVEGDPALLVRKGMERARLESPLERILSFRSYRELPATLAEADSPLTSRVAMEMSGVSWITGQSLAKSLINQIFHPGDQVLQRARAVKSQWELNKMRLAGERHARVLRERLPREIVPGMSEWEIGVRLFRLLFEEGHHGMIRMSGPGEEMLVGAVSAGDSGNYPIAMNSPVGHRGAHPAVPFLGYSGQVWQQNGVLLVDAVFELEGYHTDKTQVYWGGDPDEMPEAAASAHAFCCDLLERMAQRLRPGEVPQEIYREAVGLADREGFAEGFLGLGANKVPFLGHGIGLFVDEWPAVAEKFEEPLQEGTVLALEPKIGIEGFGMVGAENTFVVTSEGGESITGRETGVVGVGSQP
jgi:Xaa-Pro aminopeptidase